MGSFITRDGRFTDRARVGGSSGPASGPGVEVWWGLGLVLRDAVVASRDEELGTAKEVIITACLLFAGWLHEQTLLVSSWEGQGKTPVGCTEPRRWKPLKGTTEVCACWAGGRYHMFMTCPLALLRPPVRLTRGPAGVRSG